MKRRISIFTIMAILIVFMILPLISYPSFANATVVQHASNQINNVASTSIAAQFASNTVPGNLLVVEAANIGVGASGFWSISDTAGYSFTQQAFICGGSGSSGTCVGAVSVIYTATITLATMDKVTFSFSSTSYSDITILEVSSVTTVGLQTCTTRVITAPNACSTPITIKSTDFVGAVSDNNNIMTCTPNAGYTSQGTCVAASGSSGEEWTTTPSNTGSQTHFWSWTNSGNGAQAVIDLPLGGVPILSASGTNYVERQNATNNSFSFSSTRTVFVSSPIVPIQNDLLVVTAVNVNSSSNNTFSIKDNAGDTWKKESGFWSANSFYSDIETFIANSTGGSAVKINVTGSQNNNLIIVFFHEFAIQSPFFLREVANASSASTITVSTVHANYSNFMYSFGDGTNGSNTNSYYIHSFGGFTKSYNFSYLSTKFTRADGDDYWFGNKSISTRYNFTSTGASNNGRLSVIALFFKAQGTVTTSTTTTTTTSTTSTTTSTTTTSSTTITSTTTAAGTSNSGEAILALAVGFLVAPTPLILRRKKKKYIINPNTEESK